MKPKYNMEENLHNLTDGNAVSVLEIDKKDKSVDVYIIPTDGNYYSSYKVNIFTWNLYEVVNCGRIWTTNSLLDSTDMLERSLDKTVTQYYLRMIKQNSQFPVHMKLS